MLATLLITVLATYHSHIHGATLLLVPGMALLGRGAAPRAVAWLLRMGVVAPVVVFALVRNPQSVAVLCGGLMVTALIALLARNQPPLNAR